MENDTVFAGKPIVMFAPNQTPPNPTTDAIGLSTYGEWTDFEEHDISEYFELFFNQAWVTEVDTLVINALKMDMGSGFDKAVDLIVTNKDKLPKLKAIFLGNVAQEESEISWIGTTNVVPLLENFPQLEILKVRGAGAELANNTQHNLKQLIVESGGINGETVNQLLTGYFPQLEHLELWLGDSNYGNGINPDSLTNLWQGTLFPSLKYLGLRNNDATDLFIPSIINAPLINRLGVLDLSLGILKDDGAEPLLTATSLLHLSLLDLHHHYLSSEMMEKLKALPINIDLSEKVEPYKYSDGDEYYYTFIAE